MGRTVRRAGSSPSGHHTAAPRGASGFVRQASIAIEDRTFYKNNGVDLAGIARAAVENYTNRSPYPMLHLLREDSITAVAGDPAELAEIPRRNEETLRALGKAKILGMLKGLQDGSP